MVRRQACQPWYRGVRSRPCGLPRASRKRENSAILSSAKACLLLQSSGFRIQEGSSEGCRLSQVEYFPLFLLFSHSFHVQDTAHALATPDLAGYERAPRPRPPRPRSPPRPPPRPVQQLCSVNVKQTQRGVTYLLALCRSHDRCHPYSIALLSVVWLLLLAL